MKPSSAKNKGRLFQQWIRDLLVEQLNISPEDIESRSMGAQGEDILLSSAARRVFPFSIEAKNTERLNIWEAWKQACANSYKGFSPILFIKRNYHAPLIVLHAKEFIEIIKILNQLIEKDKELESKSE